jgi:hypothetical protein
LADFGRGIKAGVVTGIVYIVISGILGAIYYNSLSVPFPMYAAGLTPFSLTDLTNPSLVTELLFQYVVRGIVFGAVFAALYHYLPGVSSTVKGVVLSLFLCIVALIEVIYMTPGWPTEGISYAGGYYSGRIEMSSSFSMVWPGIISALVFGALTGFLWDRFRAKRPAEAKKGSSVLLVSFIVGGITWAVFAAGFLVGVVTSGFPALDPDFWWDELLGTSVVFLGLPGFVLADVAWRKAKRNESGFNWGVAGGVLMALTGIMLLPGALAITGGVLSGGKAASESSTAEALARDKIARTGEQKRRTNINRNIILLIISMTILTVIIIAVCTISTSPTPTPIEIRTWYDLNATRDNLGGSYLLMNDLDSTTPGYEELASPTANQGKGWQPIGAFTGQPADHGILGFEGTFEGQGYEIRDLFINRPDEAGVGLFLGVGQEWVIKDIGVVNAIVTGNAVVGTLVGWNRGAVRDSYFTGNVTADGLFVGGLVGLNEGSVSNSHSSADVTGTAGVGGLVGQNLGTVSNSYSTGSVTGNYNVGGLVGWGGGSVSNSHSSADVTGTAGVGGLVGGGGTVSNSYSIGSVTGNESVGGLVGGGASNVSNCYSTGSVNGNYTVGGLVGDTFDGTVSNSYSTGSVTGNSSAGGLVGKNIRSTVSNSFWDTQTSGQSTSDGGTGKNTTQMKDIATFSGAGWNIIAVALNRTNLSYVWNIVDNVTYPLLSWFLGCPQGPPTQMKTRTTPSGYLELTVSPAEVCANIGEQIEIRCTIESFIFTPIDISSVDVLLFDSYDSMIREQAMTMDSAWSANTVYTITGDEAYYQLKVNFTFPYGEPGEYSEYGAHSFPIIVNQNR